MTVEELIKELQKYDPKAPLIYYPDWPPVYANITLSPLVLQDEDGTDPQIVRYTMVGHNAVEIGV